jgi:uncharacterized RDD family membrane protein YckC
LNNTPQHFYIAVNGQITGPFTFDELRAKNVERDTLIWTVGLDNWTKVEHIDLLIETLQATPPPIPNAETTSSQILPTTEGQYFGYELARRSERLLATIIESIILIIFILIVFFDSNGNIEPYYPGFIYCIAISSAILGAIFYPMWGCSLGHKVMGIKVISSVDGSDQKKARKGLIREGLKFVSLLFIIPVIWLVWDKNRQNLYDKIAKTYVVKNKESTIRKYLRGGFVFVLIVLFILI